MKGRWTKSHKALNLAVINTDADKNAHTDALVEIVNKYQLCILYVYKSQEEARMAKRRVRK